jgi:hypothetical protein
MTHGPSIMAALDRTELLANPTRANGRGKTMRTLQKVLTVIAVGVLSVALAAPAAAQETEAAPEAMEPAVAVPIEGNRIGDHWVDETAPACEPGASWRFSSAGSGQLSELGEVGYYLTHCTVFDAESGGANSAYSNPITTFTTADGETLAVVHSFGPTEVFADADGNLTGFALNGTWDAAGGSGRFMSASGSGSLSCSADIPGDMVCDVSGEIAYDAAGSAE